MDLWVGVIGVVGVLVGAGITAFFENRRQAAHAKLEREKWEHERDLALTTQRTEGQLGATVEFVSLVRLVGRKARWIQEAQQPRAETSLIAELGVANEQRALVFERLTLLAPQDVLTLGVAVNEALWQMESQSSAGKRVPTREWNELDKAWRVALLAFQNAVRADLGIPGELAAGGSQPQDRFRQNEFRTE